MKQYLIFSLMLFAVSSVSGQFKTIPDQKTHPVNQVYLKTLKITPEAADPAKEANKNLGYALLTAAVSASIGAAGIHGAINNCNVNPSLGNGGIAFGKASACYLKKAKTLRQNPADIPNKNH